MQTPEDVVPPEVVDLEEEADARGYLASDEDEREGADSQSPPGARSWPRSVRSRRR